MNLHLTEMFGPTIQGEGIWTGTMATFLRTAGCSVGCRRCDSKMSWPFIKSGRHQQYTINEILAKVAADGSSHVVLTGGEPMECEEPETLLALLRELYVRDIQITVELSGSVAGDPAWVTALTEFVALWSFSPKVESMQAKKPPIPEFIRDTIYQACGARARAQLKFVVDDIRLEESLQDITALMGKLQVGTDVPVILQTLTIPGEPNHDTLSRARRIFTLCSSQPGRLLGTIRLADVRYQIQTHVLVGVQ